MKFIKKPLVFILILSFAISASGCYDSKDIENVSVILAMGVDVAQEKSVFSFAIADITSKDNSSEAPVVIKKCEALNAYDALYNLQMSQSKQLTLTHIECALFSQNAHKIYKNTLYDMTQRLGVSNTSHIAVCEGSAGDLLEQISNSHETDFSVYINDILKNRKLMPKATLFEAVNALKTNSDICVPLFGDFNGDIGYGMCIANKDGKFTPIAFDDYNSLNIYSALKGYTNTLALKDDNGAYGIKLKSEPKIKIKNNSVEIKYTFENIYDLKYSKKAIKYTNSFVNTLIKNDTDILSFKTLAKVGTFTNKEMQSIKNLKVVTEVEI